MAIVFLGKVLPFELGISFLQFLYLFSDKGFAVINFNSGVLLGPFTEGGLGDAVSLTKMVLGFTIWM